MGTQNLHTAEVKQLKAKLKSLEEEEASGQSRFAEVQQECVMLQNKIDSLESSRNMLENSLRDESSARSQLVSQVFNMRKVNSLMHIRFNHSGIMKQLYALPLYTDLIDTICLFILLSTGSYKQHRV